MGARKLTYFQQDSQLRIVHQNDSVRSYRYEFYGMEKNNEVKGEGNSYTTQFRQYDPRLGRWLSVDEMFRAYPSNSDYSYSVNNPIFYIDKNGVYIARQSQKEFPV